MARKEPSNEPFGLFSNQMFLYCLALIFIVGYVVSGFWLFGLGIGILIVWLVVLEFFVGAKKHGLKNELKETFIALLLALAVWFGTGFLLHTSSPLNAIVSCSMLPHIQRGDMVVLNNDRVQAPTDEVKSLAGIENAEIYENGKKVADVKGSLYAHCTSRQVDPLCSNFITKPAGYTERHGELVFGYEKCEVLYPKTGKSEYGPCVSWLEVNGKRYTENLQNDVIVYQPHSNEFYARVGDIIHRAFIKLNDAEDGKTYVLTKGDNNPIFDIQVYDEKAGIGNRPVEVERSKGRIFVGIPYIGYLKLFISPAAIPTPEGCDRQFAKYSSS